MHVCVCVCVCVCVSGYVHGKGAVVKLINNAVSIKINACFDTSYQNSHIGTGSRGDTLGRGGGGDIPAYTTTSWP